MRIVVFSDVHGNLPAFEEMLRHAGKADAYICLGDLVNYGPWSNECVDLALSLPSCTLIKGNHEEAFLMGKYPGKNPLVLTFFDFCLSKFSRFQEIANFKTELRSWNYLFTHTINDSYVYPDADILLNEDCVIGHSHHQFVYWNNGFTLYNSGSVGQNRKFINVINYLVFDSEKSTFELQAIPYDVDGFIRELKVRGYPEECVLYYSQKERRT